MAKKKTGAGTITICFTNNKGGSGKSTTCANLGYELSKAGKKVLLVDGDMQLNLSLSYFDEESVLEMAESGNTLYEAVRGKKDLTGFIVETPYEGIDLIPSTTLMSQVDYDLFTMMQREYVLRQCLKGIKDSGKYDYILIDAPPTLGIWVINILCASDHAVLPIEASPWGFFGLANMFDFLNGLKDVTETKIMGVLITKVDERKNYYKQAKDILKNYESIHVFDSFIHVDSAIEWAQDASKPVAVFKKNTRSALEFEKLAEEVIRNGSRQGKHGEGR
ncbi:MAG: AAA family ATPase [Lachnospiraceae bacterium]|nr:AAA family ATPase [Lachnospiraceae bacterium]